MSIHTEISRRRLLKVTALAGGGMMLGVRLGWAAPAGDDEAVFAPNAWVTIHPSGAVTLVCPRNEMGQDVYTSLTMLIAEELAVDPRHVAIEQAPVATVYINHLLGGQLTGGSTSVRDAWGPLRRAGATARVMLVDAAAARWRVAAGDCRAHGGRVFHGDQSLGYGELAAAAAKLPVPEKVALKPAAQFSVIGKPLARLDGADKARGRTVYGIDVTQPGMLYAALLPCPVIGGKVASLDAGKAESRRGVHKVVDIGGAVGVIADHYWVAHSALDDLSVQWDEGASATLDTAAIYHRLEQAVGEPGAVVKQAGDASAALAKAHHPIEARYTSQMLAHATLEPQNCLARVGDDGVDVWASTQFPQAAQAVAASAAGVAPEKVRVHAQFLGGGFGRRLEVDFVGQAVALAKAVAGKPVKLIWTREQDTQHDFYRPPSLQLLRGAVEGGRLVALTHKLISPSISARAFPGIVNNGIDPFMTEGTANLTYAVDNLDLRNVIQEVGIRVGYWRSVSNALNAFAIESFVDEMAHAAHADPVAFRLAMLGHVPRQQAVLKRAASEAGFKATASGSRAFGIASMECYGTHVALVAQVSGSADAVKLEKLTYALDCGIAVHPDQVIAQIQGGTVTGLINALHAKVTIKQGRVQQANFDTFPIPRMPEVGPIAVVLMPNGDAPGGIGEVGVPLVAPAIANAVFALTGKRVRSLPLEDGDVTFV